MGEYMGRSVNMQLSVVILVLLSGVFGEPEPQFGGYAEYRSPSAYVPSFRSFPPQSNALRVPNPSPRFFFLEATTTITTTSYSTVTCTYSSAALAACTTRKRRGITVDDDEDQQFIEASPVERYTTLNCDIFRPLKH